MLSSLLELLKRASFATDQVGILNFGVVTVGTLDSFSFSPFAGSHMSGGMGCAFAVCCRGINGLVFSSSSVTCLFKPW